MLKGMLQGQQPLNAKSSFINAKGNLMIYEQKNTIQDDAGFQMQLDQIAFNGIDLRWGTYVNTAERMVSFFPDRTAVVSHFRISAPDTGKGLLREKEFVVHRESAEPYSLCIPATKGRSISYFELIIPDEFLHKMITEESAFLNSFQHYTSLNKPSLDF